MEEKFINRIEELKRLEEQTRVGGLVIIYGRRRAGKTRLATHFLAKKKHAYSQAIESSRKIQIEQMYGDLAIVLDENIKPENWSDFFQIISLNEKIKYLCIDEFPYLVESDPSLPSIIQKWLDHKNKDRITLILMGSSFSMMHSLFLDSAAALYGRSKLLLQVKPMSYFSFCNYFKFSPEREKYFLSYSLVGGIPRYWKLIEGVDSVVSQADKLFFNESADLEHEPIRLLKDEKIEGLNPLSVLEAIGRGAEKPSEIAGKMGVPQTQLGRVFHLLMDTSLIRRETPFGVSPKDSKKTLYKINDPTLLFWFGTYSPHRSLWHSYDLEKKKNLIRLHASKVFENEIRLRFPSSQRYWDKFIEIDSIHIKDNKKIFSEIKFSSLDEKQKKKLLAEFDAKLKNHPIFSKETKISSQIQDWNSWILSQR